MSDETQNEGSSSFFSGRIPLILLGVLLVVSLIAVCILGYSLYRSMSGEDGGSILGQDSQESEPTPFPETITGASSANEALVYGISDSSTVTVTLDVPVELILNSRKLPVQPQNINPDGAWSPGVDNEDSAGWVFGTIINYIMALAPTDENEQLLQSLSRGESMVIKTQSGTDLYFEVDGQQMVAVNDNTVFNQLAPGMTIVLLETEGDQRLVVDGRFLISEPAAGSDTDNVVVGMGETALVEDLQVTVNGATLLPNDPNAPSGFSFFVIDYQIFNAGSTTADINTLQLSLTDEIGNLYVLNPVASQLGQNQPLTGGFLNPGESTAGSIGYQIPSGLTSASLIMNITNTSSGANVKINIPYTGSSAAANTSVSLQSVTVSDDLSSMTLVGQISNNGDQTVLISQDDISLRTPDGSSYLLLAVNPPFSWTIPAGETIVYSVTFQRPVNVDSAVFTILNQPFQLTNLQ